MPSSPRAGEKAFCTGIDRNEVNVDWVDELAQGTGGGTESGAIGFASPFMLDDPGEYIGPKSNDLWKPVIAAVNGMACGGAFYMLGEVEFIVAADHATFFDPHVTYGMPTAFEPVHMLNKVPFPEIMRMSLMGNAERVSAQRGYEIGLVSEVVPAGELHDKAQVDRGDDRVVPDARGAGDRALDLGRTRSRAEAGARARLRVHRDGPDLRGPEGRSGGVREREAPAVAAAVTTVVAVVGVLR